MQHGVDAIRGTGVRSRFVVAQRSARGPWSARKRAFRTVSGPSPVAAGNGTRQPLVAIRAAARRLGTIGALPLEHERSARVGASGMRWSAPRAALRDHRRRSASPWRG